MAIAFDLSCIVNWLLRHRRQALLLLSSFLSLQCYSSILVYFFCYILLPTMRVHADHA
jgi:hypothetical protein